MAATDVSVHFRTTCRECGALYDAGEHSPHRLHCGHVRCLACVQRNFENNTRTLMGRVAICFECSQSPQIGMDLPLVPNLIPRMSAKHQRTEGEEKDVEEPPGKKTGKFRRCTTCTFKMVMKYGCGVCDKNFCDTCWKVNHTTAESKTHRRLHPLPYCDLHKETRAVLMEHGKYFFGGVEIRFMCAHPAHKPTPDYLPIEPTYKEFLKKHYLITE